MLGFLNKEAYSSREEIVIFGEDGLWVAYAMRLLLVDFIKIFNSSATSATVVKSIITDLSELLILDSNYYAGNL